MRAAWEKAVPRPPPRATSSAPCSAPQHQGHAGTQGPRGTVGLAAPSRDFSLQDFPMEEDLPFPGLSGWGPGRERYPSSLRGEPQSPPETQRAALMLPLFHQSAEGKKAGKVPAARGTGGHRHPPAPKPSRRLAPAALAIQHAGADAGCCSLPAGMRAVGDTITCTSKARRRPEEE